VAEQLIKRGITADARLAAICGLFKDRCDTTVALAGWAAAFYADVAPSAEERAQHVTPAIEPALATLSEKLAASAWNKASISAAIKETITAHGIKMPQLAMPVRVLVMGTAQTPSLDAVLELQNQQTVLTRLQNR
jgi:glutamyl-tRNA synthetase